MSNREQILQSIKNNQPATASPLPDIDFPPDISKPAHDKFTDVLAGIGGVSHYVKDYEEINAIIKTTYPHARRIVTTCEALPAGEHLAADADPHTLDDVALAVITAHFAVAENAALWITEDIVQQRALPFITQQLAVIVKKEDILDNMHQAYQRIGAEDYGFGTFIAGPSKTADIEQSLVLGAHGPKTMYVFILSDKG
jgi:L-lactate dehydrogenase complex protein LldG